MANKYYKTSRKFINQPDEPDLGAVHWEVRAEKESCGYNSFGASLHVWDCNKKVRLEFGAYNLAEAKRRAAKIDRLINQLQEFKKSLGEAFDYLDGVIGDTHDGEE